ALKPDGGEIFVSNFGADTISEIATNTNEVGGSYVIGAGPVRGVVSADNTILYVSNFKSDTIAIYSIDDGKPLGWIQVGRRPDPLAQSELSFCCGYRSRRRDSDSYCDSVAL